MSDFAEMAEAFHQARTAPDPADKASAQQMLSEMHGVAAVRERLQGQGAEFCADCDEPIPDARRKAYPSAVCCVECQGIRERRA
ncbi:TraR/DksA family transcriptional regulator [Stutzerimonas stutzeri]|nr:TraR/DksA family transcriptional regulator [Stutzerimonas stutzeri]